MNVLVSLLLGAVSAIDVPTPPAATPPAAGAFRPFDLTYMPRATQSVLAVRPNELLKHLGDLDVATTDTARRVLAAGFAFLDGDLKAAPPPALGDIEQVVVCAQLVLGIETEKGGRSQFNVGGLSSGVVRTARPFDWAGRLKKWFPTAEVVEHAGRSYVRVPVVLGKEKSHLALFAADDRTLAFDTSEDEVRGLLDRLAKKVKAPAPFGWADVSRDLVAVSHDTAAPGWLTAPDAPQRELDQALVTVARKTTGLAVGLSSGSRTSFRVFANGRDEESAQEVRRALELIVESLSDKDEVGPTVAALFSKSKVSRDCEVVRVTGSVAGDLLRRLLDPDAVR